MEYARHVYRIVTIKPANLLRSYIVFVLLLIQMSSMLDLAHQQQMVRSTTSSRCQQAQRLRKARKTSLHRHLLCIDESKELSVATTSSSNSKSLEATFSLVGSLLDDAINVANKSAPPDVDSCRIRKVDM